MREPREPFLVVVALLTPFDADGRVAIPALKNHVRFLLDARVDGIMPCGTTGEGPLLTDDEVVSVVAAVVDELDGRALTIAHIGRPSTLATIRLARAAVSSGADAVAAVVPYYYSLREDEIAFHFAALISDVDVPVLAYTIPSLVRNELSRTNAERLASQGLAGVKDSTKSLESHKEYLEIAAAVRRGESAARDTQFDVYMGSDGLILPSLRAGGRGCVSALANVYPQLLVELRDAAVDGDVRRAGDVQAEILELRKRNARASSLAVLKSELSRSSGRKSWYPQNLRAPGLASNV